MNRQTPLHGREAHPPTQHALFRVLPGLDDLEWLHAHFVEGQRYARHSHVTYAIGVVESGVEGFRYRGARYAAGSGQVVVVNPQEPHDGYPVGDHFRYRMLYPSVRLMAEVANVEEGTPFFPEGVVRDPALAEMLVRAHQRLATGTALEGETMLRDAMRQLVKRHGRGWRTTAEGPPGAGPETRRAREYIEDRLADRITLRDLAAVTGLPPQRLCRAFARHYGLPPHAYQISRRVERARGLLAAQHPIAAVAARLGFTDQSHLNRCFRERVGITPGQYRSACKNIQDTPPRERDHP